MNAAPVTIGDASAEISRLVELANLAGGFAAMGSGRQRERFLQAEAAHMADAMRLAGPVSADLSAMGIDELYNELLAEGMVA